MSSPSLIPEIQLLLISPTAVTAFNNAQKKYLDPLKLPTSIIKITIHEASLSQLEADVKFDLAVSPANSSGILDGAFDDALSRALSPRNDYFALTRLAQDTLHRTWRGFAPPGTCTLVPLPSSWRPLDTECADPSRSKNVWGAKYVALCPTMRVPQAVSWDREVVYECIWALLNAIYNHNQAFAGNEEKINSVMMSPLATGSGFVPEGRWAEQLCLAIKHFVQAVGRPEPPERNEDGKTVVRKGWPEAHREEHEVAPTWR